MRLYPVIKILFKLSVPQGGVTFAGKFLPEGTVVSYNLLAVHMDKSVYRLPLVLRLNPQHRRESVKSIQINP
jgi:hypothetical protein